MLSGALRLEVTAGPHREVLVGIVPAISVFGQTSRRGGGPRIVTVRAGPASTVLLVSDAALERIGHETPSLWRAMSALVYEQLDAAVHLTAQLLALRPRARIALRIALIAKDGTAQLAQSDLAELTGLSRKAVNAHLAALSKLGIIAPGYGNIRVLAPAALAQIASA